MAYRRTLTPFKALKVIYGNLGVSLCAHTEAVPMPIWRLWILRDMIGLQFPQVVVDMPLKIYSPG